MLKLNEIHRPNTLDEALEQLGRPGSAVLAGGTYLVASRPKEIRSAVDVSRLGLAYIKEEKGGAAIGAATKLADVADSAILRSLAGGVVAQAAHRSAGSLMRNQRSLLGALVTEPAGLLATVLTGLGATLSCLYSSNHAREFLQIEQFLARLGAFQSGWLVAELLLPASSWSRIAIMETVARTPSDKPIVSVCAAVEFRGRSVIAASIALGGVGDRARRAASSEAFLTGPMLTEDLIVGAATAAIDGLIPHSDYRGSADYRREMAKVLTARALRELLRLASE